MERRVTPQGESPPRILKVNAGDTEVVSMKTQQRSGPRILPWAGSALLLATLIGVPRGAGARYFRPQDPPYTDGDPTADDQPSPTPKLSRDKAAAIARSDGRDVMGGRSLGRLIWLTYVRVWIRITVR